MHLPGHFYSPRDSYRRLTKLDATQSKAVPLGVYACDKMPRMGIEVGATLRLHGTPAHTTGKL